MLKKYNTGPTKTSYKYSIEMPKDDETKNRFQLTISNKYQVLASLQNRRNFVGDLARPEEEAAGKGDS